MAIKEKLEYLYRDELFSSPNLRKAHHFFSICLVEFMGTFYMMTMGCAGYLEVVPVVGPTKFVPDYFVEAFGWAMSYGSAYVLVGHISGLFLNPVLTLVMVIIGHMSIYRMIMYMVVEFGGGLVAIFFLKGTMPNIASDFCLTRPPKLFPQFRAMLYELWGTFLWSLLFCILHDPRTKDYISFAPVKLMFGLTAIYLAVMKYSGCSLNPARSIAASICADNYQTLWIYLVGPFSGGIIAAVWYLLFWSPKITEPQAAEAEED